MVNIEAARKILSVIPKSKYANSVNSIIVREKQPMSNYTKIIMEIVKTDSGYYRTITTSSTIPNDTMDYDNIRIEGDIMTEKISVLNSNMTEFEYHKEYDMKIEFPRNTVAIMPTRVYFPKDVHSVIIDVGKGIIRLLTDSSFKKDIHGGIEYMPIRYDDTETSKDIEDSSSVSGIYQHIKFKEDSSL